uniref:Putative Iron-sulfur cluster-binding protein n=1 Tax=Magnetococcus massalia (strain MO-1) TaxID=451514 RepID=A0A1S7LII4_MAGMO|nr:putative Iron-sulfur cluster-binding protein [Candidatus Magnetococcus massalia]
MTMAEPSLTLIQHWQRIQLGRRITRTLFFLLFLLAPALDLFRVDLLNGGMMFFGQRYTPGVGPWLRLMESSPAEAALHLLLYLIVPIFGTIVAVLWIANRYGRIYCGWFCPHFAVVEWINGLMLKGFGKPTLWEEPQQGLAKSTPWRVASLLGSLLMAFTWALSLLTYLLPPDLIFGNLLGGTLSFNQSLFLTVATIVLFLEFTFARHLFCRFGCAVGMAQSIAWMANRAALSPLMQPDGAAACASCNTACETACPMRIPPRRGKRHINTCTQCGLCVEACAQVQPPLPSGQQPLVWVRGEEVASHINSSFIHRSDK